MNAPIGIRWVLLPSDCAGGNDGRKAAVRLSAGPPAGRFACAFKAAGLLAASISESCDWSVDGRRPVAVSVAIPVAVERLAVWVSACWFARLVSPWGTFGIRPTGVCVLGAGVIAPLFCMPPDDGIDPVAAISSEIDFGAVLD